MHGALREEDALDVKCSIVKLAARFYSLGCALGLPASTLETIKSNNPGDSEKALEQVISTWLAQNFNTEPPSWRTLVKAVAHPAGGNARLLAKEMAEDHPGRCIYIIPAMYFME